MMRKQRGLIGLLAIVAAVGMISCQSADPDLRSVVVAQFGDFFLYAPLYVAADAGFAERNGLSVRIISTGGDETTWASVLGGRADFGVADPTFIAIAGERGQPGVLVASLVEGVPFWGITFRETVNEIATPSDLAGLVVGTFPAPSTAFALQRRMFEEGNLPPSIREGAPGTLIPLARAGAIDIALELEPSVSVAVAEGARVVYAMSTHYPDFAITGVTVAPQTLERDSELVGSFLCALQQAFDFIRQSPDSAVSILTVRFPEVSGDVARVALQRIVSEGIIPETGVVTPASWDAAIQLRRAVGDLSAPAEYTRYVRPDFAEHASRECRADP